MDDDITLLAETHDEIAVQQTSSDTWDIYVEIDGYWSTESTEFLRQAQRRGITVLRSGGEEWTDA